MSFEIKLIQDKQEAEKMWKMLAPTESLYDDWDFRNTFHTYQKQEIFFIAGYTNGELTNVLPLQFDPIRQCLEFFGSSYMEDNRVLTKLGFESSIPALYDYAKTLGKPLKLEYIRGDDPFTASLPVLDNKFVLPLDFTTTDEYILKTFSGETKKKLVKRLRKSAETVSVEVNNFNDIPQFLSWNVNAYGGEAAFADRPFRNEIFTDLLTKSYPTIRPNLLTFGVGGKKLAIAMGLLYNGQTYCSVNSGFNPDADSNLREFALITKINEALKNNCTFLDAFTGDYGWKERWGFKKIPQHGFIA